MSIRDERERKNQSLIQEINRKKAARLAQRAAGGPEPERPPVTVPGRMAVQQDVVRLEGYANELQARIDELQAQLRDAAAQGGTDPAGEALRQELADARTKLAEADERLSQLQAELLDRPAPGEAPSIELDLLDEVPGRKRNLSPEEYAALRENIIQHGIIEPIKIRAKADGRYEIVSGHNRTQIYREIGAVKIPYTLDTGDEETTDERAFFINLFHPDLPDFEKYLGLQRLIMAKPELDTSSALAAYIGMPEGTVRMLLKFASLPQEAFELLRQSPKALGANAAEDLAALAGPENDARVTDAIRQLVESGGKMTQQKAVELARKPLVAATPRAKPEPIKIKSGKANYCSMVQVNKAVRIEFTSEEEASAVRELVKALLEQRAKEQKR